MSYIRRYLPDKRVTPQSWLQEEYDKVYKELEAKKRETFLKAVEGAEAKFGFRKMLDELKKISGNEVTISYSTNPKEDSPMGKIIQRAIAKYNGVEEQLYEAHREASLRVSLGKGAEEKLAELKTFSAQLQGILKRIK